MEQISVDEIVQEIRAAYPSKRLALHGGRFRILGLAVSYVIPSAFALVLAAIGWQVWVRFKDIPIYILPAPSDVLSRLWGDLGFFAREGAVTLGEAMAGFVLGAGVALFGATLMAHSRFLERSLLPLAVLVKVTPIVAVAPLLVIWFGFGVMPKIFIAALITFFPSLVNGVTGFRSVNPGALDFLRSLRASRREVFLLLRVPSAMPYLFAAFRVSIPLSVIGAVVGEWFTADRGLGSVIIVAHSNLDMPTLFGAIFTLAFIGIGLTLLVSLIERRVLFWHESSFMGRW
ncbi:MAG: ABC transporter permease [Chloroflexi bacterium]|nr:ABC transporter permease [Chloroflexota bacterium]